MELITRSKLEELVRLTPKRRYASVLQDKARSMEVGQVYRVTNADMKNMGYHKNTTPATMFRNAGRQVGFTFKAYSPKKTKDHSWIIERIA